MAQITLSNLAHSYFKNPTTPEDWALKEMNHVWNDGEAYARYVLYQKLAPGYRSIMTNTADSPLMEVFRNFAQRKEESLRSLLTARELEVDAEGSGARAPQP